MQSEDLLSQVNISKQLSEGQNELGQPWTAGEYASSLMTLAKWGILDGDKSSDDSLALH